MRSLLPATALPLLAAGALAAQPPDSAARVARVDQLFARWSSTAAPGCAVSVRDGDRTTVERAYGMADLERDVPNTPATVFEAGSVSKQFTAAAILLLAERGKLSLDDDVRKHVPELPDYTAQGGPVTLRHMLHHTSGLRDWGTVAEAAGWPRTTRAHTQAHVVDIASRQRSLNYRPGAEYLYSNTGYNLMAVIVGRVSGVPFAEFTRRELFAPLGMASTGWRDDHTRVVKGRAVAYARREDGYHTLMPFEDAHGNGGLLTTVGDLQRWNAALDAASPDGTPNGSPTGSPNAEQGAAAGGGPSPAGLAAALRGLHARGRLTNGREITYARGLVVDTYAGAREVSHSGATAGYRGWAARYPGRRLSVALLCNTGEANPTLLGRRVADAFLDGGAARPAAAAASARPVDGAAALAARYAGTYTHPRTLEAVVLRARGDTLVASGVSLVPRSATEFTSPDGRTRATVEPAGGGRAAAVRVVDAEGDTVRYAPAPPAAPNVERLAEYAGEYHSDEAEVTYVAAVDGGKLVLRARPGVVMPLDPAYADAFTGPVPLVRFTRDARGRVDGMSFGLGRVRDLRFRKVR